MDTQTNTTPEQKNHFGLIQEDRLDLEMSPVEMDTATVEIKQCNDYLSINNQAINHQIAEVTIDAINVLYNESLQLQVNLSNFVTGLKLHFAVNRNIITLLYQPVFMTREPSDMGEPFFEVKTGKFYTYDPSTKAFSVASDTDATNLINNYKTSIRIKHRRDNGFTPFIKDLDTEAAIFPFQTIFALLNDNEVSSVFFYNSIRKESVGGSYSIKHCLLLSSKSFFSNGFLGKMANRSHLCPPSCNQVQYALAL